MYLARLSHDVVPVNRGRAIDFIQQEVPTHPPEMEVPRVAAGSPGA